MKFTYIPFSFFNIAEIFTKMPEQPPPEPENPEPPDVHSKWVSNVVSIINASVSFISLAAQEWLNFLIDQPVNPPFEFDAKFADESKRIARLVVIVVVLSVLVIGGAGLFVSDIATMQVIRMSLGVLIGAFLIAILYKPFAFVFGVRVVHSNSKKPLSLRQILFSVLYTCVPWMPVFSFLWIAVIPSTGTLLILILLAFWLCCFYVIYNFAKTIVVITKCRWYLVWLSLIFPLAIVVLYILFR